MSNFFASKCMRWSSQLASCFLCSCAMQSQPVTTVDMPQQWKHAANVYTAADTAITRNWWRSFGSEELNVLVDSAQLQSFDIAAAVARVHQAQASTRIAGATLWPALAGTFNAGKSRYLNDADKISDTRFSAGLSASYELDFWGKNSATNDSARKLLRAAEFDRDAVQLTVTAGVASAWLQAISLRERGEIANRSLYSAKRLLALVESRVRAGATTQLELAQQRGIVASQQRVVAAIRQQSADSQNVLAVLLGKHVSTLVLVTSDLKTLQIPEIDSGIPSELLFRRPDIARTEAQLAAASANIVAARAAMFPSLSLSADIGFESSRFGGLFNSPLFAIAAGLSAPIFNAGRLAAGRDLAQAEQRELLAIYRKTIISAFSDVEAALSNIAGIEAQHIAQDEEVRQAQQAFRLAESRYRAGAETLLVLLDAQRSLYAAQDMQVQLKAAYLQANVDLYKALGGGWQQLRPLSADSSVG